MKATITYPNAKIEQITFSEVLEAMDEDVLLILETENGYRSIPKEIQSIIIEPWIVFCDLAAWQGIIEGL